MNERDLSKLYFLNREIEAIDFLNTYLGGLGR